MSKEPVKYTGKHWNVPNTSATNRYVLNTTRGALNTKSKSMANANTNAAREEMRNFVPNSKNARNNSNSGTNHPKEAILIMGHGNEGWKMREEIKEEDTEKIKEKKRKDLVPDLVKVPKGSIVVIKSHTGDIDTWENVQPMYIKALSKENEEAILDPIGNINKIRQLFGSVAIYREGDMCPNLLHIPINAHDGTDNTIDIYPSGIISIPLKPEHNDVEIIDYIKNYKLSFQKNTTVHDAGNSLIEPFKLNEDLKHKSVNVIYEILKLLLAGSIHNEYVKNIGIYSRYLIKHGFNNGIKTIDETINFLKKFTLKNQAKMFERKPNCITYAFNCRFIDNHEIYVPESVRLGTNDPDSMVINSNKNKRLGVKQKQFIDDMKADMLRYGNSSPQGNPNGKPEPYSIVRNPEHPGNFKVVKKNTRKNKPNTNNVVLQGLNKGKNLNTARNRKRVTGLAQEIKSQITEALQQRKLVAKNLAKQPVSEL